MEMNGSAMLKCLDSYLRAIWLECCGHLSEFSPDGKHQRIGMNRLAEKIFEPGIELMHFYDFGSTTKTRIRVVGMRQGKPLTRHPIVLMARNNPLEFTCMECNKPAKWLCTECVIETEASGLLCDEHAENHPHDDYGGPLPLVNSPRVGVCGYTGPAEPPY